MQISQLYGQKKPVLSFEVFPPKKDAPISTIFQTLEELAGLSPDYISVTYGAGGGGSVNRTCEIASAIKNKQNVEALPHLTCISNDRAEIHQLVEQLQAENITNVLALRGDPPADPDTVLPGHYRYASDLIADLKSRGDFCIGAACYPEGHIDCLHLRDSAEHLKRKQDAGADFLITQLFFDNDLFWRFLEQTRADGVTLPISAGVMPILSQQQIQRMIFMCGVSLPSAIIKLLHRYEHSPADLRKAGIEHAVRQMEDLISGGVDGVHVYTMNQPAIAASAMERIGG